MSQVVIDKERFDAVIFDMDGVITSTARVHMAAWKRLFDGFLQSEADDRRGIFRPFTEEDYRRYVDGKARLDGVRSFLDSRGIVVPEGSDTDAPGTRTIHGLGGTKNAHFLEVLESEGARAFPDTIALVHRLQDAGIATAVISASRNAQEVLASAGVLDLFPVRVDGLTAADLGLPGKPDPAVFIEAADRSGARPERAVIFEDAEAGVEAGRAGGFGLVVGVDRGGHDEGLRARGAHVVVVDLGRVQVVDHGNDGHVQLRRMGSLLSVLEAADEALARLHGVIPALFLDYDGTLTPIVERPEDAHLEDEMRTLLARLAERCPVLVVSGRDVSFIVEEVGLEQLWYLGSHGFDVVAPRGADVGMGGEHDFEDYLPALDEAEEHLRARLSDIPGAQVERKKYAVAVHYRRVDDADVHVVEGAVEAELERLPRLRRSGGKRVFELRPDVEWDKGRAVLWALDTLARGDGPSRVLIPVYVGDDLTDEDAFAALAGRGLTIVVGTDDRDTRAEYGLADTDAVRRFLELVAEIVESGAL